MDIERERGITIKAQTVRLEYTAKDGQHLRAATSSTRPGTSTSTTRSRAASRPARARSSSSTRRQGVEAQTLANVYLALDNDLEILPGPQQGRPAGGRRRPDRSADRGGHRARHLRRHRRPAPRPARRRATSSSRSSHRSRPEGRRQRAAARAHLRQLVRRVPRRRRDGARHRRHAEEGAEDPLHGRRQPTTRSIEIGIFTPNAGRARGARPGRGRLRRRQHQERRRHAASATRSRDAPNAPTSDALPGFKRRSRWSSRASSPTDSADYANLRDAHGEAAPERRGLLLRARHVSEALGFGFRCGFLGPAPHGDHPGAPRARVQPRPHHDRAERRLPRLQDRRHDGRASRTPPSCPPPKHIDRIEEPWSR